jgi:hypothetical protein
MKTRTSLILLAALLTGALAAVAAVAALSSKTQSREVTLKAARVSANGSPVVPSGDATRMLNTVQGEQVGSVSSVLLLATRADQSFYRVLTTRGNGCYAAGPAAKAGGQVIDLGIVVCPVDPAFPSADLPILDMSPMTRSTNGNSRNALSKIEGFAADGVASIDLTGADGKTVSRIPVRDNVYYAGPTMPSTVVGFVARDASGREIASKSSN